MRATTVVLANMAWGYRHLHCRPAASSPLSRRIGQVVEAAGATFVDGGIIDPPPDQTRHYPPLPLGASSPAIAALFSGSLLGTVVFDAPIGAASAIKACYGGWTKRAATLLLSVRALAAPQGVDAALADKAEVCRRLEAFKNARVLTIDAIVDALPASNEAP